jgi:hypothetical protein
MTPTRVRPVPWLLLSFVGGLLVLGVSRLTAQTAGACPGTRDYRGRCVDVPYVAKAPAAYAECDKVRGRAQQEVYACFQAVSEARNAAMQYGGSHGRLFGFNRGFAAGLHDAANRWSRDPSLMASGRAVAARMDAFIDPTVRSVSARGETAGRDDGAALVRSIFQTAVRDGAGGQMPTRTLNVVPAPVYSGEDDGYRRVVPQDGEFADHTPRQLLVRMEREYQRHYSPYDRMDADGRGYVGDVPRTSMADLWFDDGVYNFDARRWLDAPTAWRAWVARTSDARRIYDGLNRAAPEDVQRHPQTGDPVLGSDGKPICLRPTRDPRTNLVTGCATIDVQAIYQRSFTDAYAHYVGHFYSTNLADALDHGYRQGIIVGTEMGQRLATNRGMVDGFNDTFKNATRDGYAEAYRRAYRTAFETEYDEVRRKAILSATILEVIGETPDGILQPGEAFRLRLRVTNAGGAAAPFSATVGGNAEATSAVRDSMPALARREVTTGVIGRVDPRLQPGQSVNVQLLINGARATTHDVVVRRALQLHRPEVAIDAPQGSGVVLATVTNISTVRTPADVIATLTIEGRDVRATVPAMNPGESQTLSFAFSGTDPLHLMFGGVAAAVRVRSTDLLMDEHALSITASAPKESLVRYFGLLNANASGAFVPVGIKLEERLTDVTGRIIRLNAGETRDATHNPWKDNPSSTIVGLVRDLAQTPGHSAEGRARIRALGDALWTRRTDFGRFLFINSGKRKAYEKLVQQIRKA